MSDIDKLIDIELPIDPKYDDIYSEIFHLRSGGFICMDCHAYDPDWKAIKHGELCEYADETCGPFETHGQARAAYKKEKERKKDDVPKQDN